MEYVYAAMLLHSAGKKITEDALVKILKSSGVEADAARAKALVAALEDVNIEEAISKAAFAPAAVAAPAAAPAGGAAPAAEAAAEEKKKEEEKEKDEEEAMAGLGALFG